MVHWIWKLASHCVIWTGYKSLKKKIKKTREKKQTKMVKRASGRKERLFTKLALVSENSHVWQRYKSWALFLLDVCWGQESSTLHQHICLRIHENELKYSDARPVCDRANKLYIVVTTWNDGCVLTPLLLPFLFLNPSEGIKRRLIQLQTADEESSLSETES